jgi:F-type H+-transporting ATPase subunit gamma
MDRARPYAEQITAAIQDITSQGGVLDHPLLKVRENADTAGILVITSDRGLCGAYNANILRHTEQLIARLREEGKEPRMYVSGRKGIAYFRFRERPVADSWEGYSEQPKYSDAKRAADALIGAYANGDIDEIHIVYTHFRSMLSQAPEARKMVPLVVEEEAAPRGPRPLYIFEPEPGEILNDLLSRYVEARVFAAMLEAAASEQSARQRAMSSATENAEELIKSYTRIANQARQTEITTEIMDIVGAAEALATSGSE